MVGWTARAKFRAAEDLTASAFSPDLSAVVVAGPDELVHVYDRDTGVAIRQFAGCDKNTTVDALASGPRGLLLTGGSDRNARVWDLSSGAHTLVATLPHPRGVRAVAHSPATGTVATGCLDGVVRLYHETGGDALFVGDGDPGAANPSVEALSFSRSGSQLASCGYGYSIKVWPVSPGVVGRARGELESRPTQLGVRPLPVTTFVGGGGVVTAPWSAIPGEKKRQALIVLRVVLGCINRVSAFCGACRGTLPKCRV